MINKIKKDSRYWFVVLVLFLSVSGCKTKQKIPAISSNETKKEADIPKPKTASPQITYLNYEWLSYRMSVDMLDYSSKKVTMNVSAFFVNRKDSIMYIAISKLGIEGARIVITPDTVKYINHLENTYYSGDYSFLNKFVGFNVNFKMLQAIFAGEDIKGFNPNIISQEIKIEDSKITQNNIKEVKTQISLLVQYGNYAPVDTLQSFFQQMELSVPSEKLLLSIKVRNTSINVPGPTSIKIPDKYKPLDLR